MSGKAVENNFKRQGCFLPSEPAGGLPFGPFLDSTLAVSPYHKASIFSLEEKNQQGLIKTFD